MLFSFLLVLIIARYQMKSTMYAKELMGLFVTIPPVQIDGYSEFFEELRGHGKMHKLRRIPLLPPDNPTIRKCSFMKTPERRCTWYTFVFFLLLVLSETICCIKTFQFLPPTIGQLKDMNALLQSENFQIEAQIEINELLTGVDTINSIRFRGATDKINTPPVSFVISAVNLLSSRLP